MRNHIWVVEVRERPHKRWCGWCPVEMRTKFTSAQRRLRIRQRSCRNTEDIQYQLSKYVREER